MNVQLPLAQLPLQPSFRLKSFTLESGLVLTNVRVAFRTWGTLSAAAVRCLIVAHSLTDNAAIDTWWAAMLGDGRAFDTSRYFVVCANMLGSCYGTTRPPSTCGCSLRVRSGLPPREDRTSNLVEPVRGIIGLVRAQAVPGGEAHRTKMSDVHAERAPGALMDPTDPRGARSARTSSAQRARAARASEGV